MKQKIIDCFNSFVFRSLSNPKTTFGGGTLGGIAFAAFISKLEEVSGCHFAVAFGNVDWMQLAGFVAMQVFGAITTDGDKTVDSVKS